MDFQIKREKDSRQQGFQHGMCAINVIGENLEISNIFSKLQLVSAITGVSANRLTRVSCIRDYMTTEPALLDEISISRCRDPG